MTYQVLARKYRPRIFEEMVGQEHALRALINALNQDRLHHAYLFTGTRGVGKTTIARILAKCLNCETGVSAKPCDQCKSCEEINTGRFVDLIEVDAASRTKVEDTRELLDNVQYAPTRGRYKVYLIDEVHMLSGHSFNALLKTLEEPPSHVKFLLATTDPQRLPITVLSRCLQFNLKNLAPEKIQQHFVDVLNKENVKFENNALFFLAKGACGSLRDGLSLLDQAIAYGGGEVNEHDVRAMLGTIEQTHILHLLTALVNNDATALIEITATLTEQGIDFSNALEDLLTALHQISVLQRVPTANNNFENHIEYAAFAKQIAAEDLQLYYQIGLIGRRDLALAPSLRSGFEMVLLRMLAFRPGATQFVSTVTETPIAKPTAPSVEKITQPAAVITPITAAPAVKTTSAASTPVAPSIAAKPNIQATEWLDIVSQLNLTGFAQALAKNCVMQKMTDNDVYLLLDPGQLALRNPNQEARLAAALTSYFGKPMHLQISAGVGAHTELATPARIAQNQHTQALQTAAETIEKDTNIQTIINTFDAKIVPGSIQVKEHTEQLPVSEK